MNRPARDLAANVRKTRSMRVLGRVDIAPLQAAVQAIPETVWEMEDARKPNKFEALGQARHIVFRFIDGPCDWRSSYDCPAWPQWRSLITPVLMHAVGQYGYARGAFPRVMLARLPAGAMIHPHIDANPAARWPHKIHVPLSTNPHVLSCFGGEERHLPVGEAVEVNNLGPHWVHNRGSSDRVHLIFEYYDVDQAEPGWLAPLLQTAERR